MNPAVHLNPRRKPGTVPALPETPATSPPYVGRIAVPEPEPPTHMTTLFRALALTAFAAAAAHAQRPSHPAPSAQVMVLGTYHFANPGLDIVKHEVPDILSTEKQAEVLAVVDAIARFRPTRIALEVRRERAPLLDSLYRAYRAGAHTLSRSESQQLGFRIAERLDLPTVHAIDVPGDFPYAAMMEYAQTHDPAAAARTQQVIGEITALFEGWMRKSVGEVLRLSNEPAWIDWGHGHYLAYPRIGAGDGYVGAELLAAWYTRNIKIFANLQQLAGPGERVLVIYGSGHSAILRELIEADPSLTLVEAVDYLPF